MFLLMMTGAFYRKNVADPITATAMLYAGAKGLNAVSNFLNAGEKGEIAENQLEYDRERDIIEDQQWEKNFGLNQERVQNQERQAGFKRTVDALGAGNTLANQASGAQRLRQIRNAGHRAR